MVDLVSQYHGNPALGVPDIVVLVPLVQSLDAWLTLACAPRRMETPSPDSPADLESIWPGTDRSVHLPRILTLSSVVFPDRGPLGTCTQLVQGLAQVRKVREDAEQVLMVTPYWPNQTWFSEPEAFPA